MREENMQESMEDFLMCLTRHANASIHMVLHTKLKSSISHLFEWHSSFVKLCMALEERLSSEGFHVNNEELYLWVEEYTTRPEDNPITVQITGTKAEQDYVWAQYEWMKLGANHQEAVAALREINRLGEHIEAFMLHKKKYLMTVVKSHERMSKKKAYVS
jgi:hypothetical protein